MRNQRKGHHFLSNINIVPIDTIGPILLVMAVGVFTFWVTPVWTNQMVHYSLETKLDDWIPFVPIFVIPYVFAYIQWIVGFITIARKGSGFCKPVFYGEVIAKLLVCVIFICFPTTMVRPEITGTDIFSRMVAVIYQYDAPINLFPSIHCMDSWICFRCSLDKRYFSSKYAIATGITTGLICLSTVLIKQHVVADIFAGIAVAEIGLFLSRKFSKKA